MDQPLDRGGGKLVDKGDFPAVGEADDEVVAACGERLELDTAGEDHHVVRAARIGDRVGAAEGLDHVGVVVRPAEHFAAARAGPADQEVGAVAARERVGSAEATDKNVVAVTAVEAVIGVFAGEEDVVPEAAREDIPRHVVLGGDDDVGAGQAVGGVLVSCESDEVVAGGSGDGYPVRVGRIGREGHAGDDVDGDLLDLPGAGGVGDEQDVVGLPAGDERRGGVRK